LLQLLNPEAAARDGELQRQFLSARPFRHVTVDNFLDAAFCGELMKEFPAFDELRAKNEMGEAGRKATVPNIVSIGPAYRQFDKLMRSPELLSWMGRVASIPELVYDPDYVGGGTHENLDGQDLDLHVDFNFHPKRPLHRRLNLIVFLNPEWRAEWGGCLELLEDPWSPENSACAKVVPVANRAVLFETTETSWHGFSRIQLPWEKQQISRRSLAVYFYTRERPAKETAPSHGTVYIPRPLPAHIEAGYRLEPADVQAIRYLITRRDGQIRFLYERELEFSEVIGGITRSPSFRLGRLLTWPLRKLRG
jgi:Rps23 Pro-64 3,4-dihydroxylase Tpa1-like proline 4-hydroxylase